MSCGAAEDAFPLRLFLRRKRAVAVSGVRCRRKKGASFDDLGKTQRRTPALGMHVSNPAHSLSHGDVFGEKKAAVPAVFFLSPPRRPPRHRTSGICQSVGGESGAGPRGAKRGGDCGNDGAKAGGERLVGIFGACFFERRQGTFSDKVFHFLRETMIFPCDGCKLEKMNGRVRCHDEKRRRRSGVLQDFL